MKKAHSHNPVSPLENLEDPWFDQNRLIEWISEYGRNILYAVLGLSALLLIVFRFSSSSSNQAEKDYLLAQNDFLIFQQNKVNSKEAFEKLQEIMQKHPDLQPKYQGRLAQILLNQGDVQKSQALADHVFARTEKNHLPLYTDYAKASLLIAQQNYQEALLRSLDLKQMILAKAALAKQQPEQRTFGDVLFAFNLIRIAFLQEQLGSAKEELNAWQEFKQYANWDQSTPSSSPISATAFTTLINHFEEGQVSLKNYIDGREKALRNK